MIYGLYRIWSFLMAFVPSMKFGYIEWTKDATTAGDTGRLITNGFGDWELSVH